MKITIKKELGISDLKDWYKVYINGIIHTCCFTVEEAETEVEKIILRHKNRYEPIIIKEIEI